MKMAILKITFMMKFILGEFLKILETALELSFVLFSLKNENFEIFCLPFAHYLDVKN